jgi:hypothetical protein
MNTDRTPRITRHGAGSYTIGDWSITRIDFGAGFGPEWMARSDTDRDLYLDPMPTLRDAKRAVLAILAEETNDA